MRNLQDISGYHYTDGLLNHSHDYILPTVLRILREERKRTGAGSLFEIGCGNGSVANKLAADGFAVRGVDASTEGIIQAKARYPHLQLEPGSAYDDLSGKYGQFPVVLSLEVVEHLYAPRDFAARAKELVLPGGLLILSTPYHGYLKNLAIAAAGKFDTHVTALWDHGHIKFWSFATLTELLKEAGFSNMQLYRVGRIPPLAKSMIVTARG